MKKILTVMMLAGVFACQAPTEQHAQDKQASGATASWQYYGEAVTAEGAVDADKIPALAEGQDSLQLKVRANVLSSCPMKGCWMKVKLADGEEMRVTFKDYGFFVPKDLDGEEAIFVGTLSRTITDVETLRHYAEDEGASEEEINQITEPEEAYSFVADGVMLSKPAK